MIFPLQNSIMPYAWGSTTAIAALMGETVPSASPQAELWMGAHLKAPSKIQKGARWISLRDAIRHDPDSMLGQTVAARFENRLPYLFKVLAVAQPLSIQAHPDKAQAKEGFQREEALGIPFDSPYRNYRDENHKPECICALTPFWALNGFRSPTEISALFKKACRQMSKQEIDCFEDSKGEAGLKRFLHQLLAMPSHRKEEILTETVGYAQGQVKSDPVWDWIVRLAQYYPGDIGILAPLLLNLVCLSPGQAMFLPAGQLHAYLEGTGLELMANSDNVIRGGLTPKHVDVNELLDILVYKSIDPEPIFPRMINDNEDIFDTLAVEFFLTKITLSGNGRYQMSSEPIPRVILCVKGSIFITGTGNRHRHEMNQGASVFIDGTGEKVSIEGSGVCYLAGVPV